MTALPIEVVDQLAAEVISAGFVKIQVRLAEVDYDSEPPSGALTIEDVEASIGIATRFDTTPDGKHGRVMMTVRYTLRAIVGGPEGDEEDVPADEPDGDEADEADDEAPCAWQASVEFQGQWILESAETLTDNHVRAFAIRVGLMAIHPYARSQVQSLVAESGWGLFTMDVLTNVDSIFASADNPDLLDLEGIGVEREAALDD